MLPAPGAKSTYTYMIRFKRYIRPGVVASIISHLVVLIGALLSVNPNPLHAPPPEAMVVEVVTPDELARFEGTLSKLHSSGSETPSPGDGRGPVTQAPPPKPRPQTEQETQRRPVPPRKAQDATAARPPAPEATQAELVRTERTEPEKQSKSERQSASPPTEQSPEQPNIAEEVKQYVALGGPLGGGFAAPPVDTNVLGYDWTAPFRERVGMCSKLEGVDPSDKVSIKISISFNRDGTLMSPPHLLVPAPSARQKALMEGAVNALQNCQPFTMLPPEKYKQWKTMVVYVTPTLMYR
jgi:hypothetical protein